VRPGGRMLRPGARATLRCHDGSTQTRTLHGAEGRGGVALHFFHFGCGASSAYDALELTARDGTVLRAPGGPLDRALRCDEAGCREIPRG
jgi:hypothetical protein